MLLPSWSWCHCSFYLVRMRLCARICRSEYLSSSFCRWFAHFFAFAFISFAKLFSFRDAFRCSLFLYYFSPSFHFDASAAAMSAFCIFVLTTYFPFAISFSRSRCSLPLLMPSNLKSSQFISSPRLHRLTVALSTCASRSLHCCARRYACIKFCK